MKTLAIWLIRLYQVWISPRLPPGMCSMEPSCSHYGLAAVQRYGFVRGVKLIHARLARCGSNSQQARALAVRISDPVM